MHACIFGLGGRTLLALRGVYRQPRLIPGPNACKTDDTYTNRTNGGELHLMNNQERKAVRIARDKARKAEKRAAMLAEYGCFEKVISNQTMHKSLLKRRDGVEWKGSVQKYLQYAIVKIYRTKHSLLSGEMAVNKTVRKMTVVERGKVRQVQGGLDRYPCGSGCFVRPLHHACYSAHPHIRQSGKHKRKRHRPRKT